VAVKHILSRLHVAIAIKIRRLVAPEVDLAKIAQHYGLAEDLDLIVRVNALRQMRQFIRIPTAVIAGRDIAHFQRRITDRATRFSHI